MAINMALLTELANNGALTASSLANSATFSGVCFISLRRAAEVGVTDFFHARMTDPSMINNELRYENAQLASM